MNGLPITCISDSERERVFTGTHRAGLPRSRRRPLSLFSLKSFRLDTTMPPPHADDQHRRERQQARERQPALHPVHVSHDGGDLIREEVGQPEPARDAERGGAHIGHDELPERDACHARRQERRGAESHHMPCRDDRLQRMAAIRRLQPLLPLARQDQPHHAPVEDVCTPVPADPVEHHIAGEHAHETDGKSQPPPDDPRVAQDGGRDDGRLLGDGHPQAAEQEHGENPEVREVLDESLEGLHGTSPAPDPTVRRRTRASVSPSVVAPRPQTRSARETAIAVGEPCPGSSRTLNHSLCVRLLKKVQIPGGASLLSSASFVLVPVLCFSPEMRSAT